MVPQELKIIPESRRRSTLRHAVVVVVCVLTTMIMIYFMVMEDSDDSRQLQKRLEILENLQFHVDSQVSQETSWAKSFSFTQWLLSNLQVLLPVMNNMIDDQDLHFYDDTHEFQYRNLKLKILELHSSIFRSLPLDSGSLPYKSATPYTHVTVALFVLLFIRIIPFVFRMINIYIGLAAAVVFFLQLVFFVALFSIPVKQIVRLHYGVVYRFLDRQVVDANTIYVTSRAKSQKRDAAPYFSSEVKRHLMEDVVLVCKLAVHNDADCANAVSQSFWWAKNSRRLSASDRMHLNVTMYKSVSGLSFLIRSTLTLELINEDDFGNYTCGYCKPGVAKVKAMEGTAFSSFQDFVTSKIVQELYEHYSVPPWVAGTLSIDETFAEFKLIKASSFQKPLKVVPGGIFIDHIPYWTISYTKDIQFNDTIWGIDNFSCCSIFAQLYWMIYRSRDLIWEDKFGPHFRYLVRQQCICKEDFTRTNYVFSRLRYDVTQQRHQVVNITFPQPWVFIPRLIDPAKNFFMDDENETLWTSRECLSCLNSSQASTICSLRAAFINILFNTAVMFNILYFLLALVSVMASGFASLLYLHSLLKWVFLPISKFGNISKSDERFKYDMYLTYDENDKYNRLLAMSICEYIKKGKEMSYLRVFDTCRDIRYGRFWIPEIEKAIERSHSFVILASTDFMEDDQKKLELEAIKLASVDLRDTPFNGARPIFVLKTEQCSMKISHLMTCTSIPNINFCRENFQVDQYVLDDLVGWMWRRCCFKSDLIRNLSFMRRLRIYGFTRRSVAILCLWFALVVYEQSLTPFFDLDMEFRKIFFAPHSDLAD